MRARRREIWLRQLKWARERFDASLSHRSMITDAFRASPLPTGSATYFGDPVDVGAMYRAMTLRILWLKKWLDYGRAVGEREGFYRDGKPVEEDEAQ